LDPHSEPAGLEIDGQQIRCTGAWTLSGLSGLGRRLAERDWPEGDLTLDGSRLSRLDTSGALRLLLLAERLEAAGRRVRFVDWRAGDQALLDLVRQRRSDMGTPPAPLPPLSPLAELGRLTLEHGRNAAAFLSFIGEVSVVLARSLLQPGRIRWKALVAVIETAGVNALPIVALLSFLIGVVIAYQGGVQLKSYGANIFVVELVTLTLLRELAPLLTAIIVAGRTGSAFTAQIGTMRVTEEVDALATIGINPLQLLVLPKLLGLIIVLPLLSLFADVLGVLGGMVMAAVQLDVSFREFFERIPQAVSVTSLLIGIGKAPVFAAIIALVGCYQGFQVRASAESVGRQTTLSVVQSIFLVIIADAVFSVIFSTLGI
jgi:phospholipid/cholesterol/gamma-HCH transport system permease protein